MNRHPPIGTVGLTERQAEEKYGKDNIKICTPLLFDLTTTYRLIYHTHTQTNQPSAHSTSRKYQKKKKNLPCINSSSLVQRRKLSVSTSSVSDPMRSSRALRLQ